jgi:uncharacterized phage-associated protein
MYTTAPFRFDASKAVEIILYIANRLPKDIADRLYISKVVYTADRYHLRSYGRFLCGDRYIHMGAGPVPSGIYDFLKGKKDTLERPIGRIGEKIIPKRDADTDYLSESDIECLDQAIQEIGSLNQQDVIDRCHDSAWEETAPNRTITVEAIARTFPDGDSIISELYSD